MLYSTDLNQLSIISEKALQFLREADGTCLCPGQYELGDGDYVNIEEYTLKTRAESKFESHRKFFDIQIILEGEEFVEVASRDDLIPIENYNCEADVEFYDNSFQGVSFLLNPRSFIVFYPEDGHMPCLSVGDASSVKKAVFKIRIPKAATLLPRLFVMDADGTLTDGKIYESSEGELLKAFDIKDGLGIHEILPELKIEPVVLTGRTSFILEKRCADLGISEVYQGVNNKLSLLLHLVKKRGLTLKEVLYIGDDLNDLSCMEKVKMAGGLTCCPSDAVEEIRSQADYIAQYPGGRGAVRDCIDWLKRNSNQL